LVNTTSEYISLQFGKLISVLKLGSCFHWFT